VTAIPGLRLRRLDLRSAPLDPDVAADVERLVRRGAIPDPAVREGARRILEDVRRRGTVAVREANAAYGGGTPDGDLVVEPPALAGAAERLDPAVRTALEAAAGAIRRFAEVQRPVATRSETVPGVEVERRWSPLASAGAYVPGGSAAYPSSLLMTVVPARVAGVGRVIVASPADRDGRLDPVLLGAAGLAGVDALLVAGGAQAVAALAFGLLEVRLAPVDRIVGPGNAWVTAAKMELAGEVGIDLPAGPSEGMVLADATADPRLVAADLVTQAEHGPDSPAILVAVDPELAGAVEAEVEALLAILPRRAILERSLAEHGRIVLVPDLDAGIAFVDAYAPEHLSIEVADAEAAAARVHNAGSVFVGPWAPESAGDYATGANHVLPTGGLARSCGALSVEAFGHFVQVQRVTREGLATLRPTIATLASAEGLGAHRHAAEIRFTAPGAPAGPGLGAAGRPRTEVAG
jgi:histidinol dehydrogenase